MEYIFALIGVLLLLRVVRFFTMSSEERAIKKEAKKEAKRIARRERRKQRWKNFF